MAEEWSEQIRELHSKGLTDAAIARELDWSQQGVWYWRSVKLGLPSNQGHKVQREAARKRWRLWRSRNGRWKNLQELRAMSFRLMAAHSGWPEDIQPTESRILNLLQEHRRLTRGELCFHLDRQSLRYKGKSFLVRLEDRGLVERLSPSPGQRQPRFQLVNEGQTHARTLRPDGIDLRGACRNNKNS